MISLCYSCNEGLHQWIAAGRTSFHYELAKLKKVSAKISEKISVGLMLVRVHMFNYTLILDASSDDSTLFYKLINTQRNPGIIMAR